MAQNISGKAAKARRRLYIVGVLLLLAGYGGAGLALRAQARIDAQNALLEENGAGDIGSLDSRANSQQLEALYGKSGIVSAEIMDWLRGVTHGRGLAETLIIVSSASALGCFLAAGRITTEGQRP
jgi:hypothetical protein